MYQPCLDENFETIPVWFSCVTECVTKKEELVEGAEVATRTGKSKVKEIIPMDISDETLYHLVLDGGSRTYAVSDVFVSGYTDDTKYNYKKGELV